MGSGCVCEVCRALAGIDPRAVLGASADAVQTVLEGLPEGVRDVLRSQTAVRDGYATARDLAVVEEAARRCTGGRFEPAGATQ